MEIQEIIQALEDSKKTLDQLTIQLANASKERNTKELEYNKRIQVEIEKARQEGIQATLIKDIVKSRLAEAKRLIDDNKVGEAKKIWKDIFGREFPVLDEEDAKNIADASKKGALKYSATTGLSTIAGSAMAASKGFYGDV